MGWPTGPYRSLPLPRLSDSRLRAALGILVALLGVVGEVDPGAEAPPTAGEEATPRGPYAPQSSREGEPWKQDLCRVLCFCCSLLFVCCCFASASFLGRGGGGGGRQDMT